MTKPEIDLPTKVQEAVRVISNTIGTGLPPTQKDNLKRLKAYLRGMRNGTNTGKPGRPRLPIAEVVRRAIEKYGADGNYFDRLLVKKSVGNKRSVEDIESEIDRLIHVGELFEVNGTICIAPMGFE